MCIHQNPTPTSATGKECRARGSLKKKRGRIERYHALEGESRVRRTNIQVSKKGEAARREKQGKTPVRKTRALAKKSWKGKRENRSVVVRGREYHGHPEGGLGLLVRESASMCPRKRKAGGSLTVLHPFWAERDPGSRKYWRRSAGGCLMS